MSTTPTIEQTPEVSSEKHDRTGRSRLVSNVMFTWAGQLVFFVSGFIMPRLIDRKLGHDVLGVWDFSWMLITSFRFVDMGITASVSRFVARYWGQQDIRGINRVVSSATVALTIAAVIVVLCTIGAVISLPYCLGVKLHEYVAVTQESVLCLGLMAAIGTAVGAYNGVLTGCHRWELQTMRNSLWQFITVVGMIIALALGGGLVSLAAVYAIGQTCGALTMVTLAYRACPGLQFQRSLAEWNLTKELYIYSGKALLPTISEMLLNQATGVMIMGARGADALAVFTRPRALLRQLDSLERKMAMILIPTTSSLEACGDLAEIKNLLVKSVRYSIYLVLPLVMILIIFGGQVMRLWMGPHFADWTLPAIMAIGFLGNCIQTPIIYMLEGLNCHGRGGVAQFIGSAASAVAVFVTLKFFHGGLTAAAVAVTAPLLLVNMIYLPLQLCGRLKQSLGEFYAEVAVRPLLHVIPFTICLIVGRIFFKSYPIPALALCAAGGLTLAIFYWRSVLPEKLKSAVRRAQGKAMRLVGISGAQKAAV